MSQKHLIFPVRRIATDEKQHNGFPPCIGIYKFSNRFFIGAFVFFVVIVVGGTLYIKYVERQTDDEFAATDECIKQFNKKLPVEAPIAEVQRSAAEKQGALYQQR